MLLKVKAQSTAEYAIVIGLVVAIAAGVLGVTLKGGIRQRQKQAVNYLLGSGYGTLDGEIEEGAPKETLFTEEYRKTDIQGGDAYIDQYLMEKEGKEKKMQQQVTTSTSVNVEKIEGAE